jgi:putative protease
MLNIGLRSIKIEGRMKTEHYIVTVINAYRKIIDNISNSKIAKEYIVDIKEAANRDTDEG